MKIFVVSADDRQRIDGSISSNILNYFPERVTSLAEADVALVVVSFFNEFKFSTKLWSISEARKPWVMLDFTEVEWCYFDEMDESHLFGRNTASCRWFSPAWHPLDEWAKNWPPCLYLKRELLKQDCSDTVQPVEWPCYMDERPLQSEDEFNSRKSEIFFSWGFSNPSRPRLMGNIFHGMNTHGLGLITHPDQYEGYFRGNEHARTWMAFFTPHWVRQPIADLRWYQERAKITVSLPGCGKKCFRSTEAPVSSIMALHKDDLAWSYDWIDGENCIRIRPEHEFEDLNEATKRSDLYEIYKKSQETIAKYRPGPYVRDYLIPLISEKLPTLQTKE